MSTSSSGRPTSSSTGWGARDVSFTLMGTGDCFDELVALRDRLGLQEYVEFLGRVPDELVADVLSTADVGLCPDPKNPLNDVSTMNKTMEYMAFGLPVVAFDLQETRVSAATRPCTSSPTRWTRTPESIVELLDDRAARRRWASSAASASSMSWPGRTRGRLRPCTTACRAHIELPSCAATVTVRDREPPGDEG